VDGGAGSDRIWGQTGNDTLVGGAGDDEIDGGDGNDALTGSQGNDRCVCVLAGDGRDVISDATGVNRLSFGPGITLASLQTTYVGTTEDARDLLIAVSGSDSVQIRNGEASVPVRRRLELTPTPLVAAKPPSSSIASIMFGTPENDALFADSAGSRMLGDVTTQDIRQ